MTCTAHRFLTIQSKPALDLSSILYLCTISPPKARQSMLLHATLPNGNRSSHALLYLMTGDSTVLKLLQRHQTAVVS